MEALDVPTENETGTVNSVMDDRKMEPNQYDVTVKNWLTGVGAEKYLDIFRQHNIGQTTLAVLTEADLLKLGVEDPDLRKKMTREIENFPISCNLSTQKTSISKLSLEEISEILTESADHLRKIYMSMNSVSRALNKKAVSDTLIYEDKYASDVALATLTEITSLVDSMEDVLKNQMKVQTRTSHQKKIIVGTLGSAVIITLAVLFSRSLKLLK